MFGGNDGNKTRITDMPPEIIDEICGYLTLEDIAHLQDADPLLDTMIEFVFFPKFNKMRVTMDDKGAMITVSPRSTHSYIDSSFSISGDSKKRRHILQSLPAIDSLTISCSDHRHDYSILEEINRTERITLSKLTINCATPPDCKECTDITTKDAFCRTSMKRSYRKLTAFVQGQAKTLSTLKVSTSNDDSISVELKPTAVGGSISSVNFSHRSDFSLISSLIYPLFNAFNSAKPAGPSSVNLLVDWSSKLDLALQSAFMVALPIGHRSSVRSMRIDFSAKVSSLSHEEIHACLVEFSQHLTETWRLKELLCNFQNSQIDPCLVHETISALSSKMQLSDTPTHRIRVLFDAPVVEENVNRIKEEWAMLPKVY